MKQYFRDFLLLIMLRIFLISEKKSSEAKRLAKNLSDIDALMYKSRDLQDTYQFVWLVWVILVLK